MSWESTQKEDYLCARVKAQVMVRDDNKGGWVPLGVGGISSVGLVRFSKTDSTSSSSDFYIQGCRMSDRTVILRCALKKDLQYIKANPTFHHWRSGAAKYGLTFQSSTDAKTFERNVKRALHLLVQGVSEKTTAMKLEKTQMHAKRLERYEKFSRANSTTSTTVSTPTLVSPTRHSPSSLDPLPSHRLSSPIPPSSQAPTSLYHLNSYSGHTTQLQQQTQQQQLQQQQQQQQQTQFSHKSSTIKKARTPVENLRHLLNGNIFNKNMNENANNAVLPKPWWYFTFPSFNLKSKQERQDRNTRSSLPDNIKILTSYHELKGANKPLLLPPEALKEMRHSVSGAEYCKKTPLLPSCQQLRPSSHHSSTSSKRRFEIFGRMTSKLMTFSSISCPNDSRCCDNHQRASGRHPSVPNPPSSSLPAMAGWSVTEKKILHHPSSLILPFPNPPPPFLLQPSSSSSSNKNYGTIYSDSEFALRTSCDNGIRERCRFCNEEFSSTTNLPNACLQAPDRVALWIDRVTCCFLARPLVQQCCMGEEIEPSYKRQESSEGGDSSQEARERTEEEGCDANKWALRTSFLCFSLAIPCLCLYWPLTLCHLTAVRCGCCNLVAGGRHESV